MYFDPSGQLGGAETSLLEILASLRDARPDWPLHVVAAADGPFAAAVAARGATATVIPFPPALAAIGEHGAAGGGYLRLVVQLGRASSCVAQYVARLREEIRAFRPNVLHTNGLKMHLLAAWAADALPLVWHVHDYLRPRPLTGSLLRWNASRCAVAIANSNSVADDVRRTIGGRVDVRPIYNAIDLRRFSPGGERADLDQLAGLAPAPPHTVRVGLLATFARWKGHDTFLEAFARIPRNTPARGYVIGDALYQTAGSQYTPDELRARATSLGVADRIGFTGYVARPETALRALDVVVHASTAPEPFGLAIAEAMACGRATIVAAAGGAAELVTSGVDALTHTPGDARELAARITTLVADTELRARLGAAARSTAERAFDRARLAQEIIPVYERAIAA